MTEVPETRSPEQNLTRTWVRPERTGSGAFSKGPCRRIEHRTPGLCGNQQRTVPTLQELAGRGGLHQSRRTPENRGQVHKRAQAHRGGKGPAPLDRDPLSRVTGAQGGWRVRGQSCGRGRGGSPSRHRANRSGDKPPGLGQEPDRRNLNCI